MRGGLASGGENNEEDRLALACSWQIGAKPFQQTNFTRPGFEGTLRGEARTRRTAKATRQKHSRSLG